MSPSRILGPLLVALAALAVAAPALAAPSGKDVRAAGARADRALERSLAAARSGAPDAVARIADARRLRAKATRVSRRASAGRSPAGRARLLRGAASGADDAFDSYAELLAQVPPELQPFVLEGLEQFEAIRSELVGELTELAGSLPAEAREQVLAAIAAFSADGDIQALIAALSDPALSAAIEEQLQAFVTELTATLGEQIAGFEGLEELLPPGGLAELEAAMAQLQAQLEEALAGLGELLGGDPGLPELPGELCGELGELFEALGLPLPEGFCPA